MRTILFFDIESTGLDTATDKIVQLSYLITDSEFNELSRTDLFFNPEKEISPEATAVHGITNEMVKDKPVFKEMAQAIFDVFMDNETVLAGFNIMGFDLKLLYKEFERCGLEFEITNRNVFDTGNLAKRFLPRTLEATFFIMTGKTIANTYGNAHNAMNDVLATADVTKEFMNKCFGVAMDSFEFKPFIKDVEPTDEWTDDFWESYGRVSRFDGDMLDVSGNFRVKAGKITWGFGKYMGQEVDKENYDHRGLMNWCLTKDFPKDTKSVIRTLLAS